MNTEASFYHQAPLHLPRISDSLIRSEQSSSIHPTSEVWALFCYLMGDRVSSLKPRLKGSVSPRFLLIVHRDHLWGIWSVGPYLVLQYSTWRWAFEVVKDSSLQPPRDLILQDNQGEYQHQLETDTYFGFPAPSP